MATDLQTRAPGGALAEKPKVFGLFSMVLFSVSAILVADTVASSAAIGVQGIGFWIILGLLFFIPYGFVTGQHAALEGLNVVGMRRRKFTKQRLHLLRSFYQSLFFGPGTLAERLSEAQAQPAADPAIAEIVAFLIDSKKRSLCLPRGKQMPDLDAQEQ